MPLAALLLASCQPKDIYVSPDGSDDADGSIKAPYATIAKALGKVRAGTTIYLRGGTYKPTTADIMSTEMKEFYGCVYKLGQSGTAEKPITITNYDEEKVYIDLSDVRPDDKRVSGFCITGDYWILKDFDIVGIQVTLPGRTLSECISLAGGSYCRIERVNMHDGMGVGVNMKDGHDNLVLNCDIYNNYDSFSDEGTGGNTDGIDIHLANAQCTGNVIRGCRVWRNSDDGIDLLNNKAPVTIDSCWVWQNGYDADMNVRADGNGIKGGGFGLRKTSLESIPRNVISNCISWANKTNGYHANHHLGGNDWINNRAMDNKTNFNFANQKDPDDPVGVGGYDHVLRGNVSYRPRHNDYTRIDPTRCISEGNTFLPDMRLDDEDFVSLDPSELRAPRKKDGSLPDCSFLVLRKK